MRKVVKKAVKTFEIYIGFVCPGCGKKNWIGKYKNEKDGYVKCYNCKAYISWKLVMKQHE